MSRRQGVYWILTIPFEQWAVPRELPEGIAYMRGQGEVGQNTEFRHWQLLAVFSRKVSLRGVKSVFGSGCHAELSRSSAADEYVFKETTYVDGTRFELGVKPIRRNSKIDWERVWQLAKQGYLQLT